MKKNVVISICMALVLALILAAPVLAQDGEGGLTLKLNRDFGYGGLDGKIQGTFSMRVSGPDTLARVVYFIDDQQIGEVTGTPFNLQFNTGNFDPGWHTLIATGYLTDGSELTSNQVRAYFITAEEAGQNTLGLVLPILGIVLAVSVIGILVPLLTGRQDKVRPVGEYGAAGGAVCKACGLPFSRHYFAPNLVVGKLERCPHCGKWQIAARAYGSSLVSAEERLRADREEGVMQVDESEEDDLKRMLDDSRFDD
ncbi:MAG: hypothetical protein JXB38_20625 [Anaerolineales bacterium]|nr:hypothetical protein [Anaerolineales bacterium]